MVAASSKGSRRWCMWQGGLFLLLCGTLQWQIKVRMAISNALSLPCCSVPPVASSLWAHLDLHPVLGCEMFFFCELTIGYRDLWRSLSVLNSHPSGFISHFVLSDCFILLSCSVSGFIHRYSVVSHMCWTPWVLTIAIYGMPVIHCRRVWAHWSESLNLSAMFVRMAKNLRPGHPPFIPRPQRAQLEKPPCT